MHSCIHIGKKERKKGGRDDREGRERNRKEKEKKEKKKVPPTKVNKSCSQGAVGAGN